MLLFRSVLVLLFAVFVSGCVGPVPGLYPPAAGNPTRTVYVVNHGWHTGLVLAGDDLNDAEKPPAPVFDHAQHIEMGWGDEGFYRAQRITFGIGAKAVFYPTPTVLHCVAVNQPIEQYFSHSGIIRVDLSIEGFDQLLTFIESSYERDEVGQPLDLGRGIYGPSRFYRATGKYYFPNTCNKWTARALRSAGCPISPFYAVRAKNVFNQTAKFGEVIQEFKD